MDTMPIKINNSVVYFIDDPEIIGKLKTDDCFLLEYISKGLINKVPELRSINAESVTQLTIERQDEEVCEPTPLTYEDSDGNSEERVREERIPLTSVWSSKSRPTTSDVRATETMLQLRASEHFTKRFNNKTTVKIQLWRELANILKNEHNFDVDGEQCRQKFYNLQKLYINYRRHLGKTGGGKKDAPEFYETLHIILGEKDKVTLQDVKDSMVEAEEKDDDVESQNSTEVVESVVEHSEPGTSQQRRKILKPRRVKKPSIVTKSDILKEIKLQNEKQEEHNTVLHALIREQNSQRGEMINILKNLANDMAPKRQRHTNNNLSDSE